MLLLHCLQVEHIVLKHDLRVLYLRGDLKQCNFSIGSKARTGVPAAFGMGENSSPRTS